jgi:hypothetical protein
VIGLLTNETKQARLYENNGVVPATAVCVNDCTAQAGDPGRVVCVGDEVNARLCLEPKQEQDDNSHQ